MSIELITGCAGEPHVDSEDVAALNAYLVGTGCYKLNGCAMSMTTVNKFHIAAGDILWQGRHVRIKSTGEDVAVANGASGYNRNDLVVLEYKKASGIESAALKLVKGTATTGTAADPSVTGGNILGGATTAQVAIARIPITGLTVGTPVNLMGTVPTQKALGDSVSQATTRTSGSLGNGGTYMAKNGVVVVQITNSTLSANQNRAIGTLPAGLRPSVSVKGTLHYSQYTGTIDIGVSGAVSITAPFAGDYTGQAVFCV